MMRFLLAILLCLPVAAADTGWVLANAGSNIDNGGRTDWVNPGNVTADDGTNATCTPAGSARTDYVRATFSLTIPVGATINGIETRYQMSRGSSGPTEDSITLVIGGAAAGSDRAIFDAYTATPTNYDRGGAADLWGNSITRDQAVATNFGFQVVSGDSDSGADTVSCDAMWIKVTYTEAVGGTGGSFFFGR